MRKLFWILGLLVSLVVITVIGMRVVLRPALEKARVDVEKRASEQCKTCELHLGNLELGWLKPGQVIVEDIHFHGGKGGGQEVDLRLPRLVLNVALRPLIDKQVRIESVEVFKPACVFYDYEHPARKAGEDSSRDLPDVEVERIHIRDGEFTYIRDVKKTHAVFNIHNIEATSGPVGTSERLRRQELQIKSEMQVESSGHVELTISTPVFVRPLKVDTDLKVQDQNLADLSRFFKPNAGVELKGTLVRGHTVEHLRGTQLSASVQAEYKDFSIKLDPMYDRSEVSAFFTNLAAAVGLVKENQGEPKPEQTREEHLERQPTESIVSFMLRGMKEAALAVAKGTK